MEQKEITTDHNLILSYLDSAVLDLEKIIGDKPVTALNILSFTVSFMAIIETYQGLKGPQRKELVLAAFKKYMEKHMAGNNNELLILLPNFIDISVSLDRREITIKADSEAAAHGCAALCAHFINANKKHNKKT